MSYFGDIRILSSIFKLSIQANKVIDCVNAFGNTFLYKWNLVFVLVIEIHLLSSISIDTSLVHIFLKFRIIVSLLNVKYLVFW